jgi:hypothetical protein
MNPQITPSSHPYKNKASFRDPAGFIFYRDGKLFRQVNNDYKENYDLLINSNLYDQLANQQRLIRHRETQGVPALDPQIAYKILKPEQIPLITYPYEWCFGQLKDAALTTLAIQTSALNHGMSLKDASAYNIQFINNRPILIDTLSFEKYTPTPWVAYRQFCEHFLAPLALMSYTDTSLNRLLQLYPEGIPLELSTKLLPKRTLLNPNLVLHIHLHAGWQKRYASPPSNHPGHKLSSQHFSLNKVRGLVDSLVSTISRLTAPKTKTEWNEYYQHTNYTDPAFKVKKAVVSSYLQTVQPKIVWDIGGNTGVFSQLAADQGAFTISSDIDPQAIEKLYQELKGLPSAPRIFPLLCDITNPPPAIGWRNHERPRLIERLRPNLIMALALVHHLSISRNLPFEQIAEFFATQASSLIIEFIPKSDSQVQRLLTSRADIFDRYTQQEFERVFGNYFNIISQHPIPDSQRTLYLMQKHEE